MTRLFSGLARLVADARGAFRAAPVEAMLALLAGATFSAVVARDGWTETAGRLFVTFGLAVPTAFAVTLLHAQAVLRAGARWALSLVAVAAAASYAFGAYDPEYTAAWWQLASLLITAALLPFAATTFGSDRDRSWWIHARLLLRATVAAGYGAALFVGVAFAIFAVGRLFELDIDADVYAHLAGWTFFALVPWIVVGGKDALVGPTAPRAEGVRRVAGLAATFFAAPLAVGYTAILYAYAVRVAVTGEVPKNLLSPLVAGAGALWLLLAFLVEPIRSDVVEESPGLERDEGESTAAKSPAEVPGSMALTRLVRWLPPALLPMLGLGIWAVAVRIQQYGWTEFRYVRVAAFAALAVLAAAGTARLLLRRGRDVGDATSAPAGVGIVGGGDAAGDAISPHPGRGPYHRDRSPLPWSAVPVVLALATFLSAVGPWSAAAVSRRSQQARLAAAIERAREVAGVPADSVAGAAPGTTAGVPASGATPRRPVPAELYETINDTGTYLATHFGPEAVEEVVHTDLPDDYTAWITLADSLGFSRGLPTRPDGAAFLVMAWRPDTVVVHGIVGGSLYPVDVSLEDPIGRPRPSPQQPTCRGVVAVVEPEDESNLAPVTRERSGVAATLEPRSARVVVQAPPDGRRLTADLRPLADSVAARMARNCAAPAQLSPAEALVPLRDDAGNPRGQLLVNAVTLMVPADPAPSGATDPAPIIRRVSGQIFLPSPR